MAHPSDPRRSARLREQLAEAVSRAAARSARLDRRTPGPAADDLYAVPLPLAGPEEWLVLGPRDSDRVELVAADRRPFADHSDLWVEHDGQELCLRLSATCSVDGEALPDNARIGVLPGAARAAHAHRQDALDSLLLDHDPETAKWRHAVDRAARLLAAWIEDRRLTLTVTDLQAGTDEAMGEPDSAQSDDVPALAATTRSARQSILRLTRALATRPRREEIWCENGRLSIVANPLGFGFLFEPSGDALPPPLRLSGAPAEPGPARWDADTDRTLWRAFLHHGWKTPGRAEVALRQPLSLELRDDRDWSRHGAT